MRKHFYELATLAELRILREGFNVAVFLCLKGQVLSEINNFLARYCSILC